MDKGLKRYRYIIDRLEEMRVDKSARILDCGCGNGVLCNMLQKSGYNNVTGYDLTGSFEYEDIDVRVADVRNIPEADDSADVAIYSEVLEHMDDGQLADVVNEADKILKKQSYIIITTPSNVKDISKTKEHKQLLTLEKLVLLFLRYELTSSEVIYKNEDCELTSSGNLVAVFRRRT